MRSQWWNDYIGLSYAPRGRERSGLDCWGLVRLVYAEERGIELPSLANEYADHPDEREQLAALIATKRDHWIETDAPQSGDVVLLRILGAPSHVGLVTEPGSMLHIREGSDAVIERLDSVRWAQRVAGIYRYSEQPQTGLVTLAACPHPLRSARLDTSLPAGLTLAQMVEFSCERAGIPAELRTGGNIYLDGEYIPAADWAHTVPDEGARVEYRAVAGSDNTWKSVLTVVVMVVAIYYAPYLAEAIGYGGSTTATALIGAGINMVGGMLINAIFPVRPQDAAAAPGSLTSPQAMRMMQGGRNQFMPYGAVPVVLGAIRYTPPIGANTYVETIGSVSYLRMLLVWGYGPLQVSDMRIGGTPIGNFKDVEIAHLSGFNDSAQTRDHFNQIYGTDVTQDVVGAQLVMNAPVTRVMRAECSRIGIDFHYPSGLYSMHKTSGQVLAARSIVKIEYRPVGSPTWVRVNSAIQPISLNLSPAYPMTFFEHNPDGSVATSTVPVFQWTTISINLTNRIVIREGCLTDSQYSDPANLPLIRAVSSAAFLLGGVVARLPALDFGEIELYQVCVSDGAIVQVIDKRPASVTGAALTYSGLVASIAAGSVSRPGVELDMTRVNNKAFGQPIRFNVAPGTYEIRVTKQSSDATQDANSYIYSTCVLNTITGYAPNRPVAFPKNLAMTAIRIRATDQINGNVDGIAGLAFSVCPDWTGSAWVTRATRNPASLFRWVLQHPANAKAVADAQIDLVKLQYWHGFCKTNGFQFDMLVSQTRSMLDVLRDIAAAGRASPTMQDGKWTVVIDEPRTQVAQLFTPHNSWGFKGTRALPKVPHGFRVSFNNAQKGYQPDERIVYADGYSANNASLFEGLNLPGVTDPNVVHKHARFHLAQVILRPETYTLNADIEHLICTRGDLVRVVHDVPLWGLGSGRIRDLVMAGANVAGVVLDERMPMVAGTTYTLRYRRSVDGASYTVNVAGVGVDGDYDTLNFLAPITANLPAVGDLVMFGAMNSESVELIVNSIVPGDNMTAQLTLVDYSPAIYNSDTQTIPPFDSQITLPQPLYRTQITEQPVISGILSDTSVMQVLTPGSFAYRIRVSFAPPVAIPVGVSSIQAQLDFAEDQTENWSNSITVPITAGVAFFSDVQQGSAYRIRARYVDDMTGSSGPWTQSVLHTCTGRSVLPSDVSGFFANRSANDLFFSWNAVADLDLAGYELRVGNSWDTAVVVLQTAQTKATHVSPLGGSYLVKAFDTSIPPNYSALAASCVLAANDTINVVLTDDDALYGWPGVLTGMVKESGGALVLAYAKAVNAFTAPINSYVLDLMTESQPGSFGDYVTDAHDLGSVMSCNLSIVPVVEVLDLTNTINQLAQPVSFYGVGYNLYGLIGQQAQSTYEIDTSLDNVSWVGWQPFVPGMRSLRYYKLRASFTAQPGFQVRMSHFEVIADVPDRVLTFSNLAVPAAGLAVAFNPAFTAIEVVSCSLLNGSTGDHFVITGKTVTGLSLKVLNSSGMQIDGMVDLRVHGYGP